MAELNQTQILSIVSDGVLRLDLSYYGSVAGGDHYFTQVGRGTEWLAANDSNKLAALKQATTIIDRFSYKGLPGSGGLQFPRSGQDRVPEDIERATYEIANRFLEGYDPEEVTGPVASEKFGPVSVSYKNVELPLHVQIGIPSRYAFDYLYPYFQQRTLKVYRSS